jgi:asparagine synthase (glutamine-hydrolysing)
MSDVLLGKLRNATNATGKVAVAFSGGLDSSVIAKIASENANVTLYTAGLRGCKDFGAAESAAKIIGLPLKLIELSKDEVKEAVPQLSQVISNDNRLIVSYLLPLWFVCKNCAETIVFSGQGADELFAGYAKYRNMEKERLECELRKDAEELRSKGIGLDRAIARHLNKRLITPFLSDDVFTFALALPLERKINIDGNKLVLRDVARLLGLGEIAERKKRAAQYGSGTAKAMRI